MTNLSVNINKVATIRNARGGNMPNVLKVAQDCELFGAQGITVHPRPDERHIRYSDVYGLKPLIRTEFMQSFRNNLNEMTSGERGKGRLFSERDKLMRMYERMKNELQTYENNIGFLSISSKGGGGLLKEMERKIEKLKEDMALTVKKIDAIDENLE